MAVSPRLRLRQMAQGFGQRPAGAGDFHFPFFIFGLGALPRPFGLFRGGF